MGEQVSEAYKAEQSESPVYSTVSARLDKILGNWCKNGTQFERPLRTMFFALLAVTVTTFTIQNISSDYEKLKSPQNSIAVAAKNLLQEHKQLANETISTIAETFSADPDFKQAIQDSDQLKIKKATSRILAQTSESAQLSEFAFYSADQKLLYSSRNKSADPKAPSSFNATLNSALTRSTNSLEFNKRHEIVASALHPWVSDDRLIGYLNFSVGVEQSLALASAAVDAEIVKFCGFETASSEAAAEPRLKYKTLGKRASSNEVLDRILRKDSSLQKIGPFIADNGSILMVSDIPVQIISNNPEARLMLIRDVTDKFAAFARDVLLIVVAAIGFAILAWTLFDRLLSKIQHSIATTRSKLEAEVAANTAELERSRSKLIEAQKIASFGSWERDLDTNEVYGTEEFFRILRIAHDAPAAGIMDEVYSKIPEKEVVFTREKITTAIHRCGDFDFEISLVHDNGDFSRLHLRGYVMPNESGLPKRVVGTVHDITARWKAEHQHTLLARILETSLNEIYILDAQSFEIEYANKCALENLGYTLTDLKSRKIWDINQVYYQDALERHISPLMTGERASLSILSRHKRRDGSEYPVDLKVQLVEDRGQRLLVGIANDISERVHRENETREAKERAERLAYFDSLTKLSNRAGCQRDAKERFETKRKPAFLVHVDMDNFKWVNDTLGHAAGDYCLEETGRRLRELSRNLGTPYRWGGDEFVILANSSDADPNELCERARRLMRAPMEFQGNQFWPTVSMGIAVCPDDGDDFETLLTNADLALYQSKDCGKDRYTFFSPEMKIDSDEEAKIELELHQAVKEDQFFLEFQPQVNMRSQKTTGVEALVRWQHPDRGTLSPGIFLPIVEKCGLAPLLGEIVVNKALSAAKGWINAGLDFGRISVNISPAHLASGKLIGHFQEAMKTYGVPANCVTAEVLESVFLDDERTGHLSTLTELYELGVHIELDDFGTGYASLTHVADLPINGLKIDRSFTQQLLEDRKKEAVVNQLIHLARSLDIGVVCEGVETDAQYERLRMMGDFSIQGYLIARPMPLDDVTAWMSETAEDLYFLV